MVDYELKKIRVVPLSELSMDILYDFKGKNNHEYHRDKGKLSRFKVSPYPFNKYYHEFDKVMDQLKLGNTFLINLTSKHEIDTEYNLLDIFTQAKAKYKLYVNTISDKFVVFSPETFITIIDGEIATYPMKGTIDANIPSARKVLENDKKELAEHITIVDLLRNDLSIHAKKVKVTKFRYLDLIQSNRKNIYQASSEIKGTLPSDYHSTLGDILFSLLPAGSISGAPKVKTDQIIKSVESEPRGYYTGVSGIFDGQNLDSFVMIRYIEQKDDKLYYRSGGGITYQSEVEKEYQEMIDKIYVPHA